MKELKEIIKKMLEEAKREMEIAEKHNYSALLFYQGQYEGLRKALFKLEQVEINNVK